VPAKAAATAKAPDAANAESPATIAPKPQLADATKSSKPPKPPDGPRVEAPPVTPAKPAPEGSSRGAEAPKADLSQVIAAKTAEPAKPDPAAPAPAVTPAKAGAQPAAAAPLKLEGFAVQVGAFRDDDKLRQAREKLAAAKITHFTERLPSSDLTRLRAGPYKTREEADKAAATIKTAGLDGKVVPLP